MEKYFSKIKIYIYIYIPRKMNSQVEKVTMYSRSEKNPMVIPEGEHPHLETDLSSNDENRWPKGSPSEKAFRRLIVRSEVRDE